MIIIFFTSFQSGVIPLDSITNQPTFLYNTFCQALDDGKEIRTVFCDMSKAFDRVWHAGLLHKLRYLDDLLNIDNFYFGHMVDRIYPTELQLNRANSTDTEAPFWDLNLCISNGTVSTKIYDKRDDFDFDIVKRVASGPR